ncbi:MAG: DNA polymerase III subunit beta [Desulfobacteraceae bacterium]|nr:DNA polymerase III subunit beta [Desulfobacteraceae bacterium]
MKFTINKNDLVDVLSKVQGLTNRRSNLVITENVLIKAVTGGIYLSATDLETGFEGFYPAEVDTDGIVALSARKLYEIAREFPNDRILIHEIENRWIEIGNQNVQYHIVGMNADDFPETPQINEIDFYESDAAALKKIIEECVLISGAGDDKRAHINGAFFERLNQDGGHLIRLVSTDGSRLSTSDAPCVTDNESTMAEGILIPKKGLHEVAKFLDAGGSVKIGNNTSYFIVKKDVETIVIRLLEGDFPKYNEITVKSGGHDILMSKKQFIKMLKRMSILSSENYKGAVFNFNKNELIITASNPDIGEAKEDMAIKYEGDDVEMAFNPRFFIDALSAIEEDNIILNITNEEKPCLIEAESDKNYLTVIMPMRL